MHTIAHFLPSSALFISEFSGFLHLRSLVLTGNNLGGTPLPPLWADAAQPLAGVLQTLILQDNNLQGVVDPSVASMAALSCWSVAINPGLCGPRPVSAPCTAFTQTSIGELETPGADDGAHFRKQHAVCAKEETSAAKQARMHASHTQAKTAPPAPLMPAPTSAGLLLLAAQ